MQVLSTVPLVKVTAKAFQPTEQERKAYSTFSACTGTYGLPLKTVKHGFKFGKFQV